MKKLERLEHERQTKLKYSDGKFVSYVGGSCIDEVCVNGLVLYDLFVLEEMIVLDYGIAVLWQT